jgi:hypothetical protein
MPVKADDYNYSSSQLTPGQKLRLIEAIMPDLEEPLQGADCGAARCLTRNSHDPEGDGAGCFPARGFTT